MPLVHAILIALATLSLLAPRYASADAPDAGRPYYQNDGIYAPYVIFPKDRARPDEALPFYSPDGRYLDEVLFDHVEADGNPNLRPWRTPFDEGSWIERVASGHIAVTVGDARRWEGKIDWKSYPPHQLNDFLTRAKKAEELRQLGVHVDWKEYPWRQLQDLASRVEFAKRLEELGVKVDYRKYSPDQLINFVRRVKLARTLKKQGLVLDWRLYSWRQLHDLVRRAQSAGKLADGES